MREHPHDKQSSSRSGSAAPLLAAIVALLVVLFLAFWLQVFSLPLGGSAPGPVEGAAGLARIGNAPTSIPPTPTQLPTATATPYPPPVKSGDGPLPSIGAVSAIAIDDKSGAILFEKNSHAQRAPASITKIVTAIVALERGKIDDLVTVQYDASELVDSTLMGVNPADQITLLDLLYGLMLPSGNDAALAIANHIAGSEEDFAKLMNEKMASLGLQDSHFVNAHGLDARGHYSSAYDMGMIARYAMRNATFRDLAAAKSHTVTVKRSGKTLTYEIYNLNKLLTQYPGADGVKIGYTENALRTIVGSATRDGNRVFVALMGSNDLWTDSPRVLDYAFKNYSWPKN